MNPYRKLGDRTIPRHTAPRPALISARLVDQGNNVVVLDDLRGGIWPAERVSYMGAWRPRPWSFSNGAVVVEGDMVLVAFVHGAWRAPVVVGPAAKIGGDLVRQNYADGRGSNHQLLTLECRDANGGLTGTVQIDVHADDKPTLSIQATDGVTIKVGGLTVEHLDGRLEVTGDATVSGSAEFGALPTPMVNQVGAGQVGAAFTEIAGILSGLGVPAPTTAATGTAWTAASSSGSGAMLTSTTKGT